MKYGLALAADMYMDYLLSYKFFLIYLYVHESFRRIAVLLAVAGDKWIEKAQALVALMPSYPVHAAGLSSSGAAGSSPAEQEGGGGGAGLCNGVSVSHFLLMLPT
jgi:hypothetical protein